MQRLSLELGLGLELPFVGQRQIDPARVDEIRRRHHARHVRRVERDPQEEGLTLAYELPELIDRQVPDFPGGCFLRFQRHDSADGPAVSLGHDCGILATRLFEPGLEGLVARATEDIEIPWNVLFVSPVIPVGMGLADVDGRHADPGPGIQQIRNFPSPLHVRRLDGSRLAHRRQAEGVRVMPRLHGLAGRHAHGVLHDGGLESYAAGGDGIHVRRLRPAPPVAAQRIGPRIVHHDPQNVRPPSLPFRSRRRLHGCHRRAARQSRSHTRPDEVTSIHVCPPGVFSLPAPIYPMTVGT